jgi:hypothetical protein
MATSAIIQVAESGSGGRAVEADSPARLARFNWLVASLTTACLVAVPTLMVLGQALVHINWRIDDWSTVGWPSPF